MARGYIANGDSVEVVCLDDPASDYLLGLPFPVHALGAPRANYAYSSALIPWLRQNLSRFDGIVVNGIWQWHAIAVWRAARNKKPYAVFVHGALDPWFNKQYPLKRLKKLVYWPLLHRVLKQATAVLFTSDAEAELAVQSFSPHDWKSMVVPYGTSAPEGNANAQREAFESKCPAVRGRRYLLFMARIHEKKGCDLLIEAFSKVAARDPDLHLVMAGPDQMGLKTKLQRMAEANGIAERVHWPGLLQGDCKTGAFRGAEAFILPSHQENFGIAVAEALACGTPVLISNQVNIWKEIVADGAGLVADDTVEGTVKLLSGWLALPDDARSQMATRANACFLQRYSMRRGAAAVAAIFAGAPEHSSS